MQKALVSVKIPIFSAEEAVPCCIYSKMRGANINAQNIVEKFKSESTVPVCKSGSASKPYRFYRKEPYLHKQFQSN
jgi:hypothetical protein